MTLKLYQTPVSEFCRAVFLTAQALDLKYEEIFIDTFTGDTKKPEFVALNPEHTVPTIDDDGFILWESKAIVKYLVNKYAKDDSLYPRDVKKRAIVDRLVLFSSNKIVANFYPCVVPVVFRGEKSIDVSKRDGLYEALGLLDKYLTGTKFAVGDNITIADHCLIASVSTVIAAGFNLSKYPNVSSWVSRCQSQMKGYDKAQKEGLKKIEGIFKEKLAGQL